MYRNSQMQLIAGLWIVAIATLGALPAAIGPVESPVPIQVRALQTNFSKEILAGPDKLKLWTQD